MKVFNNSYYVTTFGDERGNAFRIPALKDLMSAVNVLQNKGGTTVYSSLGEILRTFIF